MISQLCLLRNFNLWSSTSIETFYKKDGEILKTTALFRSLNDFSYLVDYSLPDDTILVSDYVKDTIDEMKNDLESKVKTNNEPCEILNTIFLIRNKKINVVSTDTNDKYPIRVAANVIEVANTFEETNSISIFAKANQKEYLKQLLEKEGYVVYMYVNYGGVRLGDTMSMFLGSTIYYLLLILAFILFFFLAKSISKTIINSRKKEMIIMNQIGISKKDIIKCFSVEMILISTTIAILTMLSGYIIFYSLTYYTFETFILFGLPIWLILFIYNWLKYLSKRIYLVLEGSN